MRRLLHSPRFSGALSIALLLVVGFAGRLHEALVPHVLCAEHGESVELPSGASTCTAGSDAREHIDSSKGHARGHEHCDLALLGRTKNLLPTHIAPVARSASDSREPLTRTSASHESSVPLLLLAPKHSPPAIA